MRKRTRAIKVNHIKITERPAKWAYAKEGQIYIDTTCIGLKRMEVIIHEALHILDWNKTEEEVEREAVVIAKTLWKQGYRFSDLQNLQPLQIP